MIITACENSHITIVMGSKKVIIDFRNQNTPSIHYFKDSKGNSISLTGEKLDEEPTYKKTKVCKCGSSRSAISGKNNPFYGKKHTEESKRKMREGKKRQWKAKRGSRS